MPPSSAYLRALIAVLDKDAGVVPREIRNECHRLMQAVDANDAASISRSVSIIERLAAEASFELPNKE